MNLLKCKHPFFYISVEDESTLEPIDEDFNKLTHHLYCRNCQERLTLSCAVMIGGVNGFMKRGMTNRAETTDQRKGE